MESVQQTQQREVNCKCTKGTNERNTTNKDASITGYIDTHAHLFSPDFDADLDQTITRAREAGIGAIILPAVDSHSHDALLRTVRTYPDICYAAIGVHPTSVNEVCNWREELRIMRRLLKEQPVPFYAIGEVGLDMYWNSTNLSNQSQALAIQAQLSIEYNLPMILHVREAWNAIFPLLDPLAGQIRGVFHSFQGGLRDWEHIRDLGGFAVGLGGYITYKNSPVCKVIEQIPLEDIVLETDSPYLTPVPFRGTRNESSHIPVIAAKVAEIKGVSVEQVMEVTTARAKSIFFGG